MAPSGSVRNRSLGDRPDRYEPRVRKRWPKEFPLRKMGWFRSGWRAPGGNVETFTVTALDRFGNTAVGYRGVVRFGSSDEQAAVPDDYTFTAADGGARTFAAILRTAGVQALTVRDTVDGLLSGTQANILVAPAAAASFFLVVPENVVSGVPFDLTVLVIDAFGNLVPSYVGAVSYTSSDPKALLPADYTFTEEDQGFHTFTEGVTLFGGGEQSLTATDLDDPLLMGSAVVLVEPGSAPGGGSGAPGTLPDVNLLQAPELTRKDMPWWTAPARPESAAAEYPSRISARSAPRVPSSAVVERLFAAVPRLDQRTFWLGHEEDAAWALFA